MSPIVVVSLFIVIELQWTSIYRESLTRKQNYAPLSPPPFLHSLWTTQIL